MTIDPGLLDGRARPCTAGSCRRPTRRSSARSTGVRVVYKPVAGERPLWDFPDGTLADREVAAYLVSEATRLGRRAADLCCATGPHGPGMVQLWQEPDPAQEAVTLVARGRGARRATCTSSTASTTATAPVSLVHEDTAALRRMAVFDVVVNNADRKGGHVLAMTDGHRYGVDHGADLPRRAQAAHRAVGLGRASRSTDEDGRRASRRLRDGAGRRAGRARWRRTSPTSRSRSRRPAAATRLLAHRAPCPRPAASGRAIPWPPF